MEYVYESDAFANWFDMLSALPILYWASAFFVIYENYSKFSSKILLLLILGFILKERAHYTTADAVLERLVCKKLRM